MALASLDWERWEPWERSSFSAVAKQCLLGLAWLAPTFHCRDVSKQEIQQSLLAPK